MMRGGGNAANKEGYRTHTKNCREAGEGKGGESEECGRQGARDGWMGRRVNKVNRSAGWREEAVAVVTKRNQKASGGNDLFLLHFVYFHRNTHKEEYTCAAGTHACSHA